MMELRRGSCAAGEGPGDGHARRGLAQTQGLGRLAVGELLEVAEQDDLAVNTVKIRRGPSGSGAAVSRSASAAGVSAGSRAGPRGRAKIGRLTLLEPAYHARGRSRSRLRLPAPRCLRWASITWSRVICRSQR